MADPNPFDSLALRRVLGAFATGITVITIIDAAAQPRGMTVNSFNSVSLEPPLILWSLALNTPDAEAFRDAPRFAVNILAENQKAISDRFASLIHDRFAGIPVTPGLGEVPLLGGCAAALECVTEAIHPGGDHLIIVGRVERLHHHPRPPLLFHDGQYRALKPG